MATADPVSGEPAASEPAPDQPAAGERLTAEPSSPPSRARSGLGLRALSIALVAIIAGTSLFLSGFALGARVATTPGTPAALEQQFQPFWDVFDLIKQRWAGGTTPTDNSLIAAAIDGMLSSLKDPWSLYQPAQDFQTALNQVGGHDVGIGVTITVQPRAGSTAQCDGNSKLGADCELAVVSPVPNSPAEKAGVKAGDVFVAVNGKSVDGLTIDQATAGIKGPQDTDVSITFERDGKDLTLTITRALFDVPQVDTKVLPENVQYIHVSGINSVAQSEFHAALAAALAAHRHLFVVDVRGNGGGYVESAVAMADEFLSSGVILYQRDASGAETVTRASPGGQAEDQANKIVVLTDRNTASAAEIFAAALQGNGRAKLVGDRTFGKGVVQAWIELPGQLGGIHLTIAQWLTPQHVWINGKGLQPDIFVDTSNVRAGQDPVLDRAIAELTGAAPSPSESPSATPTPPASPSATPVAVPS